LPVIEVNDLVSGYNQKRLFQNLSFRIEDPVFIAVIGLNGSGKSTFLKTLTGKQPFYGSITVEGFHVSGKTPKTNRLISFLEQKNSIGFSIPVKELVVMGLFRNKRLLETYSIADYGKVSEVLGFLKISHLAEKDFLLLSGGEQQLVLIAQMLLQETKVWLLDEPTQQLDILRKKQVFDLLKWLVKEKKKTIFCVTHDLFQLREMEGLYINFSSKNPELKPISLENLEEEIKNLEESGI
jgi:iron complex transport system ATP-binding protein